MGKLPPPIGQLYYFDYAYNPFKYKGKTMKLSQALKEKKRLAAEIQHLKNRISSKNSYIKASNVKEKFNVNDMYAELQNKVQELVNLKIVINEANRQIQSSIYLLAEYKAMISFWNGVNVNEGMIERGYQDTLTEYECQIDELRKIELVQEYQKKADSLQDQIDTYNYTTEVAWGEDFDEKDEDAPAEDK
jgi:hypothetical protein